MRRLSALALVHLVAFVVALGVAFHAAAPASAFTPWNIPWWPGTTPASSAMVQKVGSTSLMTWEAVDSYGYNGWRDLVARSLDTGSSDSDSEGNVLNRFLAGDKRGQITIREVRAGEVPDIRHYGAPSAFVDAKCGEWGTACVYLLSARPVPAYYRVSAMIVWPYTSQAAVVRHETFHALARACDQYRAGCPRATDGVWEATFVCTGNPDTLMDCGGAARTVTAFDYATFIGAYDPSTSFLQVQAPCVGDPCWDGARWRWRSGWSWQTSTDQWYDPGDRLFWYAKDNSWGGRCSPALRTPGGDVCLASGAGFYSVEHRGWLVVP